LNQEVRKHEKIRFRREDITCLTTFPSAEGQDHLLVRRSVPSKILRGLSIGAAAFGGVLLLAICAILFVGITGLGSDRLRQEAEAAIQRLAGVDVAASIGSASLSLDGSRFVALQVRDVTFVKPAGGETMLDAGLVRFGVRFWPLISGQVRLGSATISDARIVAGALPSRDGPNWKAALANSEELIDPDRVVALLFGSLHRAFDKMEVGSTRHIELDNVEILLPEGGRMRSVLISSAQLDQQTNGELAIGAQASIDGRAVSIKGTATRDTVSRRISNVDLKFSAPDGQTAAHDNAETPQVAPRETSGSRIGLMEASVTGAEGIGGEASRLSAEVKLEEAMLDLDTQGEIAGDLDVAVFLEEGTAKVEIEHLRFATGRSRFNFHGAFGPMPKTEDGRGGTSYRYELVSDGSTVSPGESPEPALEFLARISGNYDSLKNRLTADQLGIRTGSGELLGTGSLEFAQGKAPGIFLALTIPDMPVGHVKQLWPWFAGSGARHWVLNNLYGGRVVDSNFQYRVAVGRIGNGVALNHDEVFGKFNVRETRFDVTGRIPPVRDANGTIDFRGNDLDIALSSGSVFMASGRTVAASNGKLLIRNANRRPLIGDLDINVEGDAAAVAELASYEPINAMRHVGLLPEEFTTGTVKGHVKADIPLQNGIGTKTLDWRVALDYRNLAVAKPFDGQMVTEAEGTITIDPAKAVIDAKAKLNGAPAEIALVEPLNDRGPERKRNIAVVLNDKAREALVPGLGMLLSGPVKVAFNSGTDKTQEIVADLTNAKLSIPWAGWSKGAGVPAEVAFTLDKTDVTSRLSDFKLSGKSFAMEGEVTLSNGELSSARFDTVKLNSDDDIALAIRRSGKGYAVDIKGSALDARAVIKQVTADADPAAGSGSSGGAVPVSLEANVGTLVGFHGERLSNVKLDYSGVGGKVLRLNVSGVTKSGAKITVKNTTEGNRRTMEMQSLEAGAVLRFLDIYEHMEGGAINLALAGRANGALKGQVNTTNFWVVDEPKLRSIVSTAPQGDNRSLNEAVRRDIDTSRVQFERGFAAIEKGDGYLSLERGVLRGPLIGTTFQGTLYDKRGRMAMTGTFMPAYGLNRLFGELPFVGMILGNGRDRGLIGVTYKLSGNAKSPDLQINPLSVIAPGIFRSIFEYR
jgi:Protein of unknown function